MNVFTFILAIVISCLAYDLIIKRMRARDQGRMEEDARTIQEMHKLLMRLEDRVDALETLVIDRSREEDFERKLSS